MSCWMPPARRLEHGENHLIRPDRRWCGKPKQARSGPGRCHLPLNRGGGGVKYRRHLPEVEDLCGEGEGQADPHRQPHRPEHISVFERASTGPGTPKIQCGRPPCQGVNLFGYTGGATLACAAGAVCLWMRPGRSVGQGQRRGQWLRRTGPSAGWWTTAPSSWQTPGCNTLMASSWTRPATAATPGGLGSWGLHQAPGGKCDDTPLFFAVNSYTTSLSPAVMEYMLKTTLVPPLWRQDQLVSVDDLPVSAISGVVPAAQRPFKEE